MAWLLDRRYIHFETQAVWWVQVIKVAVGMALLLAIKSGLKAFPSIDEQPSEPQAEVLIEEFMQAETLIGWIRVNRTQVSRLRVENRKEIKFSGF